MKKRRRWTTVYDEIVNHPSGKAIPEEKWEELFRLTKSFPYFTHGCWLAKANGAKKWEEKFFVEMVGRARTFSHWAEIARYSGQGSKIKEDAIRWMHSLAEDVLYRWEALKWLLPNDHPLQTEARRRIREIKKARKRRKRRKK